MLLAFARAASLSFAVPFALASACQLGLAGAKTGGIGACEPGSCEVSPEEPVVAGFWGPVVAEEPVVAREASPAGAGFWGAAPAGKRNGSRPCCFTSNCHLSHLVLGMLKRMVPVPVGSELSTPVGFDICIASLINIVFFDAC